MTSETAVAAFLMLLSLPMLGPMLAIALLQHLASIIMERKEDRTNE